MATTDIHEMEMFVSTAKTRELTLTSVDVKVIQNHTHLLCGMTHWHFAIGVLIINAPKAIQNHTHLQSGMVHSHFTINNKQSILCFPRQFKIREFINTQQHKPRQRFIVSSEESYVQDRNNFRNLKVEAKWNDDDEEINAELAQCRSHFPRKMEMRKLADMTFQSDGSKFESERKKQHHNSIRITILMMNQ
jgi:hypothetical protein